MHLLSLVNFSEQTIKAVLVSINHQSSVQYLCVWGQVISACSVLHIDGSYIVMAFATRLVCTFKGRGNWNSAKMVILPMELNLIYGRDKKRVLTSLWPIIVHLHGYFEQ